MAEKQIFGLLSIAVGFFSIFCAFKDYDWFMEHRKAKFLVRTLGRNNVRYFYMALGLLIATGGTIVFFVAEP